MVFEHITLFILSVIMTVTCDIYISDHDYGQLPPIFHIDSYDACVQDKKPFCRIQLKLTPLDSKNPSKIWKLIEETKKSKRFYNHEELFHAICINGSRYERSGTGNLTALKLLISETYSEKYQNVGLISTVVDINCNNIIYEPNFFDIVLLYFVILYLLIVLFATCYHILMQKVSQQSQYILMFSVWYNLTRLAKIYQQENCQKLKCIQTIRFYTTILVIFCHTFCSFAGGYIANTKYLEDFPLNPVRHSLRNWYVYLVQAFFLISAWLLSYQTFKIFQRNCNINPYKYICITFVNRYIRIIPPVLLMVSVGSSAWMHGSLTGPVKSIYSDAEYKRCQKNWWIVFLFLSNHYNEDEMCYFTTWYLSADTQLYILSLCILILIMKFTHLKYLIMFSCLLLGIIIPSVVSYLYSLDIIYRISPENSKNNEFLTFEFSATYTSTYVNMATYMLGLIFGYMYFALENKLKFTSNLLFTLCWLSFIGIPLIVVIASSYDYSKIMSAILAGILKPIYAMGIGIGIFGIAHHETGFLKKMFEWKPVLFLANFTYSTYVVHFGIVFFRTVSSKVPIQISDSVLFTSFIQDTILSFICGFLVHLLFEMPASHLQRTFIPKFSINKSNFENKNKKSN